MRSLFGGKKKEVREMTNIERRSYAKKDLTAEEGDAFDSIMDRDERVNTALAGLEEGVLELGNYAKVMGDELESQNPHLDRLDANIENKKEEVDELNENLTIALQLQKRGCDKFCCDIMCILTTGVLICILILITQ